MLAITTFAQSTFAGLSIVDYVDSVNEVITLTTSQTSLAQFVGAQTNTQTLTDSGTVLVAFVGTLSDVYTLTTSESVSAQFKPSCIEHVILTDCQCAAGWIKINNDQQSYQPQTYNTESIAELAFAESSGKLIPEKIGWSPIYDDQLTVWNDVNNTQTTNWANVNDNVTSCC